MVASPLWWWLVSLSPIRVFLFGLSPDSVCNVNSLCVFASMYQNATLYRYSLINPVQVQLMYQKALRQSF